MNQDNQQIDAITALEMRVKKRDGRFENVSFDKILVRLKKLGNMNSMELGGENGYSLNVHYTELAIKVIEQLYDGISTVQIDELLAQQCATQATLHPDYQAMASRIVISNHQKNTTEDWAHILKQLYEFKDIHGEPYPLLDTYFYEFAMSHITDIMSLFDFSRDYLIDYFGFKTLEKAYLMRIGKHILERPQHMWMRVAVGMYCNSGYSYEEKLKYIRQNYEYISRKYYTHATPTLYHIGTPKQQLSSCYLIGMEDDSMEGIYNTLKDCAVISKYAGGIGLHIHNIRSEGSHIRGTNGESSGIVPMLRVFNMTARYSNQSGKRPGSFAIYVEPWHADIMSFLDMKKNHGDEEARARDLFYALWIPDLFMERVQSNGVWSLMCPDKCRGLADVYGDDFKELYEKYESEGKFVRQVSARDIWMKVVESQIETGTPYMLYKDSCNQKSNQKNLGTIKSSNLCVEIVEYSSPDETAVCNLNSVSLTAFVKDGVFNYAELERAVGLVVRNLNEIIDINFYPTDKTRRSNFLHRPIGIGVQGLADAFMLMDIPFHSEKAIEVNKMIFETMYYAAVKTSMEIARERIEDMKTVWHLYAIGTWKFKNDDRGCREYVQLDIGRETENLTLMMLNRIKPVFNEIGKKCLGAYSSFDGSPLSEGKFQFDLWGKCVSDRYMWDDLRADVMKYGVRNSLLMAPMPTASTSQILGNNECFEPFTNNIYIRKTLAGEFIVINKYMIREMVDMGIWTTEIKNIILASKGSIQSLDLVELTGGKISVEQSNHIKLKYKTVWEMPMKHLIDMARDRGQYICQSQSMNLWMEDATFNKITSMHFYAWKQGLKTGLYYLRTKAKASAQQFTIDPEEIKKAKAMTDKKKEEICEMCSA
jgi:ribonucleotide reductase alpha subunit